MTLVTATVEDVHGGPDNSVWIFHSLLREASDGSGIVSPKPVRVTPVAGVLSITLDPGFSAVAYLGKEYVIEVPASGTADLWDLIAASAAFPPGTPPTLVAAAVMGYLAAHPLTAEDISNSTPLGRSLLKAANGGAVRAAIQDPQFVVSTYYGGTLGGSDDTTCIQNTINAAAEAGGGIVVIPPKAGSGGVAGRWKYSQLVIPRGIHLKGVGWHSYNLNQPGGTQLQQLTGVNADSIIFGLNEGHYVGPLGLTDLSLLGAAGSTAGHAINIRLASGADASIQDMTTIERIYGVGFAGSVIRVPGGVPIVISDINGLMNGRYAVEIEDLDAVHQVLLRNISGDGNTGTLGADGAGAVVYLKGIKNQTTKAPVVSIFGIKSEYRVRETYGNGDGVSMGGFNALIIEDCTAPITVTGVQHIASGSQTRKPGNAIQVKGTGRPNLMWQGVGVRDSFPGQTGTAPFLVYDETVARGSNATHGMWGSSVFATEKLQTAVITDANGANSLFVSAIASAVNSVTINNAAAAGAPGIAVGGPDTNIGLNLQPKAAGAVNISVATGQTPTLHGSGPDTNHDLNLTSKGTGVVKANGVQVVTAFAATAAKTAAYTGVVNDLIPADATSAGFTITLPTAPADKSRIAVKKIDSTANAVTVTAGGSDVFNQAAGSTSLSLTLQFQAVQLQYTAATGIWYVVSTDVPLGGLDARYQPLDSDLTAFAAKTAPAGAVVGTTDAQALTTKTVDLASNTLTGTTAQFNTALSDGDFATLAGAEALASKTLTAPKIVNNGFIADANGNEEIVFGTTASAVNQIKVTNAATGNRPSIAATGDDTNVDLNLVTQGTGVVRFNGLAAASYTGAGFNTFTGTRVAPRIGTTASSAAPTINVDSHDQYNVTALAVGATIAAPTGTPTDGQLIRLRIKDNGTAQTLAFNAIWRALGVTLPTTTVLGKTLYISAVFNTADTKWDVLTVAQEA